MQITPKIQKVASFITAISAVVGALTVALTWLYELNDRLDGIEDKIDNKDKSGFAVGLRIDEDTSYIYRHFDGKTYNAAYDYNNSRWYYVDKQLNAKWCFEP